MASGRLGQVTPGQEVGTIRVRRVGKLWWNRKANLNTTFPGRSPDGALPALHGVR